eukprot:5340773-Amphidinium_carterae.2
MTCVASVYQIIALEEPGFGETLESEPPPPPHRRVKVLCLTEVEGVVYDSFNLRIVYERDRTGFEESKVHRLQHSPW